MYVELNLVLDRHAPGSLATKLVFALRRAIENLELHPADRLPPTRDLAARLGVSRGTVVAAYEQLVAEGYLSAGQGRGTRVNPHLDELHSVPSTMPAQHPRIESPTTNRAPTRRPSDAASDTRSALESLVTRSAWRTAWRLAAQSPRLSEALPPEGDHDLLHQISEHLRTMRGTVRDPSNIMVTAGAREGFSLLLTALGTTRGRRLTVGVEAAGPETLGRVAMRHGAQLVTLPADEEGIRTSDLPSSMLDVVIVTPSYQYPHGSLLPLDRRQALLTWASNTGVIIIEDDFDSELRYLHAPLPTLAALDNTTQGVVATLGSFSSTLSIHLSAGFLVLPSNLKEIVHPIRDDLGCPVSAIVQLALAELLADGELRRQVARLRRARARERMNSTESASVGGHES